MHHPWVTKDGTQPLTPYEYSPPDPITQNMVSYTFIYLAIVHSCIRILGNGVDAEGIR